MNRPKNVLIVTDLEGISGISTMEMLSEQYEECCRRLMADTNAAVAGAFDGGAERVFVEDGHGGGDNFIAGMLDKRAEQVTLQTYPDMNEVCAIMQVGAHAMAGTPNGLLDHTQSSVAWHNYTVNGRRCGEMAQSALFAGAYDVPNVMMSGDRAACEEAREFFGEHCACAEVKLAKGRNTAECLPNEEAEKAIYEAAKRGMAEIDNVSPMKIECPFEIELEYNRADYCDNTCRYRGDIERLDARTVRRRVEKIVTFFDVLI